MSKKYSLTGKVLAILSLVEFVIFGIIKSYIIKDISAVAVAWFMIFPLITTMTLAVWFWTSTFHHSHKFRSIALRILATYLWICTVAICIISVFYPMDVL